MCGFAGFIDASFSAPPTGWRSLLACMGDAIAHRGPDDSGTWLDTQAGIGLSHRRLSVLELSFAGHQPMISASGRFVIVFNGEIYNHLDLRKELDCSAWRGHSDTETLLAGVERWGLERTLQRSVGMFALALWDQTDRSLTLARDRLGEKPLYYGRQGKTFLFGSQLKALKVHPSFEAKIDRDALASYLRFCYVPSPLSIYQGVFKLPPGTLMRISAGDRRLPEPKRFWSLREIVDQGMSQPFQGSDADAVSALETKLLDAVRLQQIADVPLGAFLSGGIDSSTIVALMQMQSTRQVRTFTIGFKETGYNEAEHAKAVAKHLGTDHTELYVNPQDAQNVIPRLAELYDEPFADASQIPTCLVSHMARAQVTVSLSGDAGDELFGGYTRYTLARQLFRYPLPLRKIFAASVTALSPMAWNQLYNRGAHVLPKSMRVDLLGDKIHKLANIIGAKNAPELYRGLVSTWSTPETVVIGSKEPITLLEDRSFWGAETAIEHSMMVLDALTYLPDDILVKVDRAAMGVSLETRVPFLDHRVVEFAWQIPLSMKIRDGQGKWLLRQVLYKYVPEIIAERPKMGFGVPIGSWLRGPLKSWAAALIEPKRLAREGFFDSAPIRRKWVEHQSGSRNWAYPLWSVLMFQAWLDENAHQKQNKD